MPSNPREWPPAASEILAVGPCGCTQIVGHRRPRKSPRITSPRSSPTLPRLRYSHPARGESSGTELPSGPLRSLSGSISCPFDLIARSRTSRRSSGVRRSQYSLPRVLNQTIAAITRRHGTLLAADSACRTQAGISSSSPGPRSAAPWFLVAKPRTASCRSSAGRSGVLLPEIAPGSRGWSERFLIAQTGITRLMGKQVEFTTRSERGRQILDSLERETGMPAVRSAARAGAPTTSARETLTPTLCFAP